MIPLVILFLISPSLFSSIMAALVFGLAALTDWLDGYVARATDQVTLFGRLIDPVADKLLILAALAPLVEIGRIPSWVLFLLIGREFSVSALRMIASSHQIEIEVGLAGKYKMIVEVVAIIFLILGFNAFFLAIGRIGIGAAIILAIYSGVGYFNQFWDRLSSRGDIEL